MCKRDGGSRTAEAPVPDDPALCPQAATNRLFHFSGSKEQRSRLRKMDVEERKQYLLMHAAHKDCVPCVTYWISQGVPVDKTSASGKYTAIDWAEYGKADAACALLQAALERMQLEKTVPISADAESEQGVWRSPEPDPSELAELLCDEADAALWQAAVTGDAAVLGCKLCVEGCSVPQKFQSGLVPDRMYYWQLLQYVELAEMLTKKHGNVHSSLKLQRVCTLLHHVETRCVEDFLAYLSVLPPDHRERLEWNRLTEADLVFEESYKYFASFVIFLLFVFLFFFLAALVAGRCRI